LVDNVRYFIALCIRLQVTVVVKQKSRSNLQSIYYRSFVLLRMVCTKLQSSGLYIFAGSGASISLFESKAL